MNQDDTIRMERSRDCPVCFSSQTVGKTWLKPNVTWEKIGSSSFASRKRPEFMTWGYDLCPRCKTVYSAAIPPISFINDGYENTDFISSDDASDAAATYRELLEPLMDNLPSRDLAIDVGCGPGPFLPALMSFGFEKVVGVEPSKEAIKNAEPSIAPLIKNEFFTKNSFDGESADLICLFQTIEHLPNPLEFFEVANQLLKPGGLLVVVCHNRDSALNKLLGRRSPIIDIEHLQLFNSQSLKQLSYRTGFANVIVRPFVNKYSLQYIASLLPIPRQAFQIMDRILKVLGLKEIKVPLPAGNVIVLCTK